MSWSIGRRYLEKALGMKYYAVFIPKEQLTIHYTNKSFNDPLVFIYLVQSAQNSHPDFYFIKVIKTPIKYMVILWLTAG